MALDELKFIWKQTAEANAGAERLSKEEIMNLLESKTTDIRRKIRRRLRTEVSYYIIALGWMLAFATQGGFSTAKIIYFALMLALVGIVIATLSRKSKQLRSVHLTGTLHESLVYLVEKIDSTMKSYMAAYMMLIVGMIVLIEAVMVFRHPHDAITLLLWLTGGVIFSAACYWCGRNYLEKILGRYKVQLRSCLQELQNS